MAKPTRMTTTQLRAMISGGATRSQLPTKASGQSVSSTRDSASIAYLAAVNRARVTQEFRDAQTQTARQASQERTAQMQSVADNSTNLPRNDSQNQTVDNSPTNNSVSNNVVNPSSLYTTKCHTAYGKYTVFDYHKGKIVDIWTNPCGEAIDLIEHGNSPHGKFIRKFQSGDMINVTGQSQNSSVNGGINVNANFNTATELNNYQSANPNSSINHGLLVNPPYYTAGQSSVPYNNEVKTSQLGGDIQHQETDVNTNLEYEKLLSQQSQSNVNWAMPFSALSLPLLAVGGLAGLYLLGKRN